MLQNLRQKRMQRREQMQDQRSLPRQQHPRLRRGP
jgi:hypothetical protein